MAHWTDRLVKLGACGEAVEWARGYDSAADAWAACERGDWMLWLVAELAGPGIDGQHTLVKTVRACARLAPSYKPMSEPGLAAIEMAAYATVNASARTDARTGTFKRCADIVRQHYPVCPL